MNAVVLAVSSEINIQGRRVVPYRSCIASLHPFLFDQDKNLFCEAAGSCPPDAHVIMAIIRQQCCVLASGIGLARHEGCGFTAFYMQNFHADSVGKRQRQISLNSSLYLPHHHQFYSFLSMLSVDTVNFCVCLKKQAWYFWY